MDITVNFWAVLVAGFASTALGALWYSPLLFGKMWTAMTGLTKESMKGMSQGKMAGYYLAGFGTALVTAYVLAHFLQVGLATTVSEGLQVAFWLWLGFIATVTMGSVLWEGRSLKLWLLNNAYHLVALFIATAILVSWPK